MDTHMYTYILTVGILSVMLEKKRFPGIIIGLLTEERNVCSRGN